MEAAITPHRRRRAESCIRQALAGFIAQRQHDPHSASWAGKPDRRVAFRFAEPLTESSEEEAALIKLLEIQTRQLIKKHWHAVEAVARALLGRKTLTWDEVREVCRKASEDYVKAAGRHAGAPELSK